MDLITLALSKKYISDALGQMGTLKGASAYEIAVENGFKGSEEEWLLSLQGVTPHIGDNGNWFIGDLDTGISAAPDLEEYYKKADLIALSTEEILEICK